MKKNVIIDVDTGIDDAVAIAMALYDNKINVELITCVAGNMSVNNVTKNTLNFLQAINKRDIPVAKGEKKPLYREKDNSIQVHGKNGLGNYVFPPLELNVVKENAVNAMCKVVSESDTKIDFILLGPHTNFAKLLLEHPEVKGKIGKVVVSAGLLEDETYLGFNVAQDPESAKILFESGLEIVICPSDLGHEAFLTPAEVEKTRTLNKTGEMLEYIFRSYKDRHIKIGIATHDACAIMCYARPKMCKFENMFVNIKFIKRKNTGIIHFERNSLNPNMKVAVSINIKKFKKHYFKVLKKIG